jgi:predicted nucleic acid-binding protein
MKPRRYFLDTNVLVYALDDRDPAKQEVARHLVGLHGLQLVISTQVLIELYAVSVSKLGKTPAEALEIIRQAAEFAVVPADRNLMLDAAALAEHEGLSIFDAAIVAAANRAECDQLLSEDLQLASDAVSIATVNPFAS